MAQETGEPALPTNASTDSFHKQRDALIRDIAQQMLLVTENLARLNNHLKESVQYGEGLEEAVKTWSHYYDPLRYVRESQSKPQSDAPQESESAKTNPTEDESLKASQTAPEPSPHDWTDAFVLVSASWDETSTTPGASESSQSAGVHAEDKMFTVMDFDASLGSYCSYDF